MSNKFAHTTDSDGWCTLCDHHLSSEAELPDADCPMLLRQAYEEIIEAARPLARMIARQFDAYEMDEQGHSSAI